MKNHIWHILFLVFSMGVVAVINGQTSEGKNKPLTNDSVLSLVKAGLGDSAIVTLIKSSPTDFDKSVESLIALKTSGVSNAIIEAMASAGTTETPAVAKKEDLPSSYGIYALNQNGAQELQNSPVSTVIGLKPGGLRSNTDRGMAMDGFSGKPRNVINEVSRGFVIYKQDVKPDSFSLSELVYVNSHRAADFNILGTNPANFSSVYLANPSDNIEVNLWRPRGKVEFRVEPVESRSGMFKIIPVQALKPGRYALYSDSELHGHDRVFTADTNRQAAAIYFSIGQGEHPGDNRQSSASQDGTTRVIGANDIAKGLMSLFGNSKPASDVAKSAKEYNNKGSAKWMSGDYPGALQDFDKAIEISPGYVIAYANRAGVKYITGDFSGAIIDCDKAIELDPGYSEAYNTLGYVYFEKDDFIKSEQYFKKTIGLEKSRSKQQKADTYCGLGLTYFKKGDMVSAKMYYQKAADIDKRYANNIEKMVKQGYYFSDKQLAVIKELVKGLES